MRSSLLLVVALSGSLAACGAQSKGAAPCSPVASWSAPMVRCSGAGASGPTTAPEIAVATKESPEPELEPTKPGKAGKPEPEPEPPPPPPPPPPPKAELKRNAIEVSEAVEFEADSAVLTDGSKQVLDDIASMLADHPEVKKIQIEDRTDAAGQKRKNQKLSQDRANAVKAYLVSKGVAGKRLTTKGLGGAKGKSAQVNFKITQRGK
jgi:outer membrane protein OmpA-like peptidoglycan-associated protein